MSMAVTIFNKLNEAYGASTWDCNFFEKAVLSIDWDTDFYADGEYYFVRDDIVLTTTSLDPFECEWRPCVLFHGGSKVVDLGIR